MDEKVKWFQENFPNFVSRMNSCSHHGEDLNPYHIEGSIWTHTMMVCNMAKTRNKLVQWACLLHDIAKPFTKEINKHLK